MDCLYMIFLVSVQPFSTRLFGVPIPLPTLQGCRAQQLKTRLECWIRRLHEASTQATSANLFGKECLGMQQSPKAMPLRPTNFDLPECDCHLPPMESDGRRSRPVRQGIILKCLNIMPNFLFKLASPLYYNGVMHIVSLFNSA